MRAGLSFSSAVTARGRADATLIGSVRPWRETKGVAKNIRAGC